MDIYDRIVTYLKEKRFDASHDLTWIIVRVDSHQKAKFRPSFPMWAVTLLHHDMPVYVGGVECDANSDDASVIAKAIADCVLEIKKVDVEVRR